MRTISRILAFAMVAAGMGDHIPADQLEDLREVRQQSTRRRRTRWNHYLLGGGKPGKSASAWFFREDRAKRKAIEWTRQKKALGLKPVAERSLPPEREPVNQWRRGDDGQLVAEHDALAERLRYGIGRWRR